MLIAQSPPASIGYCFPPSMVACLNSFMSQGFAGGRADAPDAEKLKVFVSYSRADEAFADELVAGMEFDGGFDVTIDRHSIVEGEDWKKRLGALIAEAHSIVFVLSPASASSNVCKWEVEEAQRLCKRILPALWKPTGDIPVPPGLASLNYVRFDGDRSFMEGLKALVDSLKSNIGWLREHTRLLSRALEWKGAGRPHNRLLSGSDIVAAKSWAEGRPANAPAPTELHYAYIRASEEAEAAEVRAERERVKKLEAALAEAEKARTEADEARHAADELRVAEAAASRRVLRRTVTGLVASLVLALAAGVAGWLALEASRTATLRESEALVARAEAESRGDSIKTLIQRVVAELESPWPPDALSPDYAHIAGTPLAGSLKGK